MNVLTLLFATCLTLTFARLVAIEIETFTPTNLQQLKASKDSPPYFVFFYSPRCKFSSEAMPQLISSSIEMASLNPSVKFAKIDAAKYAKYLQEYQIPGYPTIYLIHGEGHKQYDGDITAQALLQFLRENSA